MHTGLETAAQRQLRVVKGKKVKRLPSLVFHGEEKSVVEQRTFSHKQNSSPQRGVARGNAHVDAVRTTVAQARAVSLLGAGVRGSGLTATYNSTSRLCFWRAGRPRNGMVTRKQRSLLSTTTRWCAGSGGDDNDNDAVEVWLGSLGCSGWWTGDRSPHHVGVTKRQRVAGPGHKTQAAVHGGSWKDYIVGFEMPEAPTATSRSPVRSRVAESSIKTRAWCLGQGWAKSGVRDLRRDRT